VMATGRNTNSPDKKYRRKLSRTRILTFAGTCSATPRRPS